VHRGGPAVQACQPPAGRPDASQPRPLSAVSGQIGLTIGLDPPHNTPIRSLPFLTMIKC